MFLLICSNGLILWIHLFIFVNSILIQLLGCITSFIQVLRIDFILISTVCYWKLSFRLSSVNFKFNILIIILGWFLWNITLAGVIIKGFSIILSSWRLLNLLLVNLMSVFLKIFVTLCSSYSRHFRFYQRKSLIHIWLTIFSNIRTRRHLFTDIFQLMIVAETIIIGLYYGFSVSLKLSVFIHYYIL